MMTLSLIHICIRRVVTVDPFDVEATRAAIEAELQVEEPSLVISRRPCALLKTVKHKPALKAVSYTHLALWGLPSPERTVQP